MFYVLAYTEAFWWLVLPLFAAVWCALAMRGGVSCHSRAPVRSSRTRYELRRGAWR